MEAVRLHPNSSAAEPYSPSNPAPSSCLILQSGLPIPQPLQPGEVLIRVEATTVIRDSLTWPETYLEDYKIPGNDFAGTVVTVHDKTGLFKPGDEVYGMTEASRAGAWAEYAIVTAGETCLKPKRLSWAQAAAAPLTGLTAYQALFEKANIRVPNFNEAVSKVSEMGNDVLLVTGASGAVGTYLVKLAKLAGLYVVAATRSAMGNKDFLFDLGANEVLEYDELRDKSDRFDVIIDTVGGQILESCWSMIKPTGTLITIESANLGFVEEHQQRGLSRGKENAKALGFIVEPSSNHLEQLSIVLEAGLLVPLVACQIPLKDAGKAYDLAMKGARGKVVLTPGH